MLMKLTYSELKDSKKMMMNEDDIGGLRGFPMEALVEILANVCRRRKICRSVTGSALARVKEVS